MCRASSCVNIGSVCEVQRWCCSTEAVCARTTCACVCVVHSGLVRVRVRTAKKEGPLSRVIGYTRARTHARTHTEMQQESNCTERKVDNKFRDVVVGKH